MARLGTIDLNWLDGEIKQTNNINNSFKFLDSGEVHLEHEIVRSKLKMLQTIRDSCTPIEVKTINGYVITKGEWNKYIPIEEPIVKFSSEYHSESLLEKLATSKGNYINLLCSDMVKHWNNHYGESTMERFKHRVFGKGYKLTLITGGWSGNEDLVNAINMNPISQLCYIKWESSGLHEFFINPNRFGYYIQSDLARKLGVSRQYVNSNKAEYETMKICGTEYLKFPPTTETGPR